jgi:sigma-E factor negative regulatory protein RseB
MALVASVLTRRMSRWIPVLILAGFSLPAAAQSAIESVESGVEGSVAAQLARMAAAVDDLNYEGTLVYLADNRLEALHIVHRLDGGEVQERLVSLSGPVRAVTRHRDEVTCVLSEERPISIKRKTGVADLLRTRAIDPNMLSANYFVHPLGETRVAGRDTDVVGVIPRDDFRYGYRFYLDRQTGLPLKSDLMDTGGVPIEQIMFAVVAIDSAAAPAQPPDGPPVERGEAPSVTDEIHRIGPMTSGWRFESLPPGFALRMHDGWPEGAGGKAEHFLVTDHLASVSVFVEGEGQGGLSGATRMGAVHAAGGRIGGHQVTVVGQVPAETVAAVLAGLRHDGDALR